MPSKRIPYIRVKGHYFDVNRVTPARLAAWGEEAAAALPVGLNSQVALLDPPWRLAGVYSSDKKDLEGLAAYPVMTMEGLKALPIKDCMAKTSLMFMWVVSPMLAQALDLMKAYGFTYSTVVIAWQKTYESGKPVVGLGRWTRPSLELMLLGRRGTGTTKWLTSNGAPQVWRLPRSRVHSQKPAEIRDFLRSWLHNPADPDMRRVEFFARDRSPGWHGWGLEMSSGSQHFFCPPPSRTPQMRQKAGGHGGGGAEPGGTEFGLAEVSLPPEAVGPDAHRFTYGLEFDEESMSGFGLRATRRAEA